MKPTSASYKPCFEATKRGTKAIEDWEPVWVSQIRNQNNLKRIEKGESQVTDLQRCIIEAEVALQLRWSMVWYNFGIR